MAYGNVVVRLPVSTTLKILLSLRQLGLNIRVQRSTVLIKLMICSELGALDGPSEHLKDFINWGRIPFKSESNRRIFF